MSGGSKLKVLIPSSSETIYDEKEISRLTKFVQSPLTENEDLKCREEAIIKVANLLSESKRTDELFNLIKVTRPFLLTLGKAKAARMVRDLVDLCLKIDQDGDIKIAFVEESVEWSTGQNHNYLRQALQARLIRLFNDLGRFPKALQCASTLVRELKKIDAKELLLEVQLEESKAYYGLSSLAKARSSLVSARTIANSMYVSPGMQAGLDMQSGILHAADERDFQTAFSYFFEAFESYENSKETIKAMRALKYMLFCKVMLDTSEEIAQVIGTKHAMKYHGEDLNAVMAIGKASKNRSIKEFNEAFAKYKEELQLDPVVRTHFATLNDTMMEKELCRLIEPYSSVQISHIANTIGLSVEKVEKKLAQMILDKKFFGSLHQGEGTLVIFDKVKKDESNIVQNIRALDKAVDVLWEKAQQVVS